VVSSRKASNLLSNELRSTPDWLNVPNGVKTRASSAADEPLNASEPGDHCAEPAEYRV